MKNKKGFQSLSIGVVILSILILSGVFSIFLVPQIESVFGPAIQLYANNPIGWLVYISIRVVTVIVFPLKLGAIAVLFHRSVGAHIALFLSTIIFLVGGSINYYIGRKYHNNLFGMISSMPYGVMAVKTIKNIQEFIFIGRSRSILFFLAFSYEPLSYMIGMRKIKYFHFLPCLFVGGFTSSSIMIARDYYIGLNNSISLILQFLPGMISILIISYLVLDKKASAKNS